MTFTRLLTDFHAAVLEGNTAPALPHIKDNGRLAPQRQMMIYIEGYRIRLVQALRSDYPALLAYLGEHDFEQLARDYIEAIPPADYNLDRYPHGFAAFLKGRVEHFAYDLARLEAAIAEVFMQPESPALEPQALSGLEPEAFGALRFTPRTASRLLTCNYNVDDWLTRQRAGELPPVPQPCICHIHIVRHQHTLRREVLEDMAFQILHALRGGSNVSDALDSAIAAYPGKLEEIATGVQSWFGEWTAAGYFAEPMAK